MVKSLFGGYVRKITSFYLQPLRVLFDRVMCENVYLPRKKWRKTTGKRNSSIAGHVYTILINQCLNYLPFDDVNDAEEIRPIAKISNDCVQ